MDAKIIEFTGLLRENGLRVSIAEHLDALRAVACLGCRDRELFKSTLRATMVKRAVDLPVYDELFDLYFSGLGQAIRQSATALMGALQLGEAEFQALMDRLAEVLDELGITLSELAQALLQHDAGRLEKLLRQAARASGVERIQRAFQEGRYSHSTAQHLGLGALSEELQQLRSQIGHASLSQEEAQALQQFVDRRLQDLNDLIKHAVRLEVEKHDQLLRERRHLTNLAEKSFYYLSEEEIRRMKEAVAKLAQRLKNVVVIRRRKAKRGKFDVKDTLRKNLQYGGVPFRIQFDRRVRDKPQVVILCDVSDSVRNVSRFMLQFVYSLQDLYSRVRSFIFVSELGEITQLFKESEISDAIDQALTGSVINVFAHSDFGRTFRQFHRDYLAAVSKKTTVIVLGDARNNYNVPQEWVLRDIRLRAKQVIWLNPESRPTWGFGDSEMDRYQPFCDVVEECRNLNQLYRVIDRLVS
ncbi:MAG: hypothetical protein A3J75_05710 [Acidobacteria bacterium RBG_16_68_9]|nr:MAG: hypothetical protein A3J75_05710 [Acidobacteria bacterium RBG_16_68_9]